MIRRAAAEERKTQLFIRAITNGVLSERDRLLTYTVGEYYNEMSLFIEEQELRKKSLDEARRKK